MGLKYPPAPLDFAVSRGFPPAAAEAAAAPPRVSSYPTAGVTVALILLSLLLPYARVYESSAGKVNLCPADVLLPGLLLIYRRSWVKSGKLGWWLLGLWVLNLISWGLMEEAMAPLTLLREFLKVIACYGYALVGFGIGQDQRSERLLIRGLAVTGLALASAGIPTYFANSPQFLMRNARVTGTFNDPNGYAVYLAMLLPLIASFRLGWAAVSILAGGVVVSLSRTGLIATGWAMLLSLGHVPVRRYLPLLIASAGALAVVYGRAASTDVTTTRIVNYEESLGTRQTLWALGLDLAGTHPLFGVGKGNFEEAAGARNIVHNTFIQVAANGGYVTLLVFLLPLPGLLWAGLRRPSTRPWAATLAVALVGGLAVSFDNFRPFWLAVGVLAGKLSLPEGADSEKAGRGPRLLEAFQPRGSATRLGHAPQERT